MLLLKLFFTLIHLSFSSSLVPFHHLSFCFWGHLLSLLDLHTTCIIQHTHDHGDDTLGLIKTSDLQAELGTNLDHLTSVIMHPLLVSLIQSPAFREALRPDEDTVEEVMDQQPDVVTLRNGVDSPNNMRADLGLINQSAEANLEVQVGALKEDLCIMFNQLELVIRQHNTLKLLVITHQHGGQHRADTIFQVGEVGGEEMDGGLDSSVEEARGLHSGWYVGGL